jgi:hypothetical protein
MAVTVNWREGFLKLVGPAEPAKAEVACVVMELANNICIQCKILLVIHYWNYLAVKNTLSMAWDEKTLMSVAWEEVGLSLLK